MPLPIAHSAAGLVGAVAFRRWGRLEKESSEPWKSAFVLVVLANAADLDFVPGILIGAADRFHHGASHSIVWACLIAIVGWWLFKRLFPGRASSLFFVCCGVVAFSHLFLDWVGADSSVPVGIPVLWPWSPQYFSSVFPFFGEVHKSGESLAVFAFSLFNAHNAWEVLSETAAAICVLGLVSVFGRGKAKWLRVFTLVIALLSGGVYYSLQVEPEWIQVNRRTVRAPWARDDFRLIHLTDLHLRDVGARTKRLRSVLDEIRPDVTVLTGDIFDPFGEGQKVRLSPRSRRLCQFVSGLPGEKFLVWGEGIFNNHHLFGRYLTGLGVHVLEDESLASAQVPGLVVTGKLPELAIFRRVATGTGGELTAGPTGLNSFLHYVADGSPYALADYDLLATVRFERGAGGMGLTFFSSYGRFTDRFYRLRWSTRTGIPQFSPHGTGVLQGRVEGAAPLAPGVSYRVRIRCVDLGKRTRMKARFWRLDSPEPNAWALDAYDDSVDRLSAGTVGVWVNGSGEGKAFDDVSVWSMTSGSRPLFTENFDNAEKIPAGWSSEKRFVASIVGQSDAAYNILLSHSAGVVQSYELNGFDLLLAGGTHGGQLRWPWGTPIFDVKEPGAGGWLSGLKPFGSMVAYISRGLGTSRLPARFFCRPEIVIWDYRR